ncbi:MAG: hypothetical protein J7518_19900 [Nocardioidaceae bacterium]|nr:hypothetical protein [Nocardioidaceae bacterium]
MIAARGVLRSGWLPAALVALLAMGLLHEAARVSARDIVVFGVYLAGWLVLPGTLAWRAATRSRGPRPLAEDLAFGVLTGYVLEFPVYMACLAAGVPHLYVGWPVLVVLATVTSRPGRALWRRTRQPMPLRWSWTVAGLLGYLVLWFGHNAWGRFPSDRFSLRRPYFDEPYHLSIASSLRHFFPPKITYVDHTPLEYHWVTHAHVAASSWITGIEPVVILRSLAVPAVFLLTALALAHAAVRLSGSRWPGIVAVAGTLLAPLVFNRWIYGSGEKLLAMRMIDSPTAGFVVGSVLLGVLLCIELLRGDLRGRDAWALTGLAMVVMIGSKSTSLPTLMAGLVAATVVAAVAERRLHRAAAGLAVLAVAGFVVGKLIFFPSGSYGLAPDPFALTSDLGKLPKPAAALAALSWLGFASTVAGLFGLLARRGWRRADHVFLVALCASGFGAGLFFHQQSLSEVYFVYVVFVPVLLASALGLHRLVERLPAREVLRTSALAFAVSCVVGLVLLAVETPFDAVHALEDGPYLRVLKYALLPVLVALLAAVAVAFLAVRSARIDGRVTGLLLAPVCVAAFAGIGAAPTVRDLPSTLTHPAGTRSLAYAPSIPVGGLAAARWVRENTPTDTLLATNEHCEKVRGYCFARSFWMAGYAERQFLVEGWSYIIWTIIGKTQPPNTSTVAGPFWDPQRLKDNDAAFQHPSAKSIGRLRDRYGVRWLFVNERFRVDLAGVRRFADERYSSGRVHVFELR